MRACIRTTIPLSAAHVVVGAILGCGTAPTAGVDVTSAVAIAGPNSLRLIALGEVAQVSLSTGDAAAVEWRSTSVDVVAVTAEGTGAKLEALGNGTAMVIAQLNGESDTVTVSVEQEARALTLSLHPLAAEVGRSFRLQVSVEDSLGAPITSASGTIVASLDANPTSASLGGTVSFELAQGVGTGESLFIDSPGTGLTLRAGGTVSAPGGTVDLTSRSTPPFEVFSAGQGPRGTILGSGSWDLLAAQTVVDERLHQLLSLTSTLAPALDVAQGDRLVFRLKDMSRQNQQCNSDNLLMSECALVDWNSQPGGLNTPASGVFLNRVTLSTTAGAEEWFLRSSGALADTPEPSTAHHREVGQAGVSRCHRRSNCELDANCFEYMQLTERFMASGREPSKMVAIGKGMDRVRRDTICP